MTIAVRHYTSGAEILANAIAIHKRLMTPNNAVKDSAPPRHIHRIEVKHEPAEDPAPVKQAEKSAGPKSAAVMERLAAIKEVYVEGISASKIAELLGTSKNVIVGFYRRNPDELRFYPLVASPGRKGKE
jgi:hypothetical protein